MVTSREVIETLYDRGYRVSACGVLTNPRGRAFEMKVKSNHVYPQSQVIIDRKKYNFHFHRLAAYCFYGDDLFKEGTVVRHLSGNVLDISINNLALGTRSDNELDKAPHVRSKSASNATLQRKEKRRLTMRKFTDDQIRMIRNRLSSGDKGADIARDCGVVKDVIYAIRDRKTYKEVDEKETII